MICKFQAFLDQDEGDGQAGDERFDVQEEDSVDVEVYASATDPEVANRGELGPSDQHTSN